jgi:hypothetical protein
MTRRRSVGTCSHAGAWEPEAGRSSNIPCASLYRSLPITLLPVAAMSPIAATHPASARQAPLPTVAYPPGEESAEPQSADGLRVSEETYWKEYYLESDVHYEWNDGRLEEKPVSD